MTSMQPTTTWQVTAQQQETRLDQTGSAVNGWTITFQTSAGHVGSVFVPDAIYGNIDAVRQMIADKVAQMAAVAALSG